jgi:hypothetical protein
VSTPGGASPCSGYNGAHQPAADAVIGSLYGESPVHSQAGHQGPPQDGGQAWTGGPLSQPSQQSGPCTPLGQPYVVAACAPSAHGATWQTPMAPPALPSQSSPYGSQQATQGHLGATHGSLGGHVPCGSPGAAARPAHSSGAVAAVWHSPAGVTPQRPAPRAPCSPPGSYGHRAAQRATEALAEVQRSIAASGGTRLPSPFATPPKAQRIVAPQSPPGSYGARLAARTAVIQAGDASTPPGRGALPAGLTPAQAAAPAPDFDTGALDTEEPGKAGLQAAGRRDAGPVTPQQRMHCASRRGRSGCNTKELVAESPGLAMRMQSAATASASPVKQYTSSPAANGLGTSFVESGNVSHGGVDVRQHDTARTPRRQGVAAAADDGSTPGRKRGRTKAERLRAQLSQPVAAQKEHTPAGTIEQTPAAPQSDWATAGTVGSMVRALEVGSAAPSGAQNAQSGPQHGPVDLFAPSRRIDGGAPSTAARSSAMVIDLLDSP